MGRNPRMERLVAPPRRQVCDGQKLAKALDFIAAAKSGGATRLRRCIAPPRDYPEVDPDAAMKKFSLRAPNSSERIRKRHSSCTRSACLGGAKLFANSRKPLKVLLLKIGARERESSLSDGQTQLSRQLRPLFVK